MTLTEPDLAFLENHHAAVMITVTRDGVARTVRIGVAGVDGPIEVHRNHGLL